MSDGPLLIAYDGSPGAKRAIAAAGAVLDRRRAVVVSVWSSVLTAAPVAGGMPAYFSDLDPKLEEGAQQSAEEGTRLAREAGFEAEPRTASESTPWLAIVRLADELDASLIVIGARGLSGLKSALLGSTSRAVLHHTTRPVLVVREDED